MRVSRLILFLTTLLTAVALQAGNPADSLRRVIDSGALSPVEGFWQLTASPETVVAICHRSNSADRFDVYLLSSPRLDLPSGIVIGSATAGVRPGSFDLQLCHDPLNPLARHHYFTATFDGDDSNSITLSAYNKHRSVSLARWIPYFFRVTIENEQRRPRNFDGLVRIYPEYIKHVIL